MPRKPIRVRHVYSQEPMSQAHLECAERLLAKLIARAYVADHHPELLAKDSEAPSGQETAKAPEGTAGKRG